jgi:hypothetical protein
MDQIGAGVWAGVGSALLLMLGLVAMAAIIRIATARLELNGSIRMATILIMLVLLTQHDHRIRSVIQIVETLRATKKTKQPKKMKLLPRKTKKVKKKELADDIITIIIICEK